MCTKSAAVVSLVPVSPTRTRRAEGEEVHLPATDLSLEVRPEIRGVRLQTIWMESQAETTPGRGRARAGWRGRAGLADISPHAAPTALQMARTLAWYWRLQRATRGKRSHPQLIFCVCVCSGWNQYDLSQITMNEMSGCTKARPKESKSKSWKWVEKD